ncbi:MAG: hypothetical protein M1817_003660 [Caeruleum heppii]|nr:MAG: hypothetical protein M1817_003660 [Caeruleum heppii]
MTSFLGGVSRTLNLSYLKALPMGTTIHIHSRVIQHGRTMALIRGEMTSTDGRTVYVTAEHHKVGVPPRRRGSETEKVADERGGGSREKEAKL